MSLQLAAQHLSNQGRGPDDTLVHMSGKEVAGLQALAMAHGGSLTINPKTGLPEAGILSALIPLIAGAALGPAGFGIAESAMGAGLMVGAGSYMLNPKAGLMGGLMAGLGGAGGFGLGEGLASLGATSEAGATAQNAATQAAADAEAQAIAARTANQLPPLSSTEIANIRAAAIDSSGDAIASMPKGQGFSDTMAGIKTIATDPSAANFKALGGGSYSGLAKAASMAAAPVASEGLQPKQLPNTTPASQDLGLRYKYSSGLANPFPQANPTGVEQNYYPDQGYTRISKEEGKPIYGYASGGLSDLGSYSDGGRLLRGPGDGVSDSIPAQIGQNQPARLADGEFVVPARIVSELGNGSTEAGAKQLYKMMDRVQKARGKTTGKNKVAHNTNADRLLPA